MSSSTNTGKIKKRKFKDFHDLKQYHSTIYNLFNSRATNCKQVNDKICNTMTVQEHMWLQIALLHIYASKNETETQMDLTKPVKATADEIWKYAPFICPHVITLKDDKITSFNLNLSKERIQNHCNNCSNCPYSSLYVFKQFANNLKATKTIQSTDPL